MRLWAHRPLWQRALLPSLAFALLHLADEPFRLDALVYRTVAGVSFSLAYALRGHVWLAAGLHTGLNFAIIARSVFSGLESAVGDMRRLCVAPESGA